ncbi:SDR family NAD(P)-dependent oxidoreductase [Pseudonocardia sp. NPDC046786]|uniref:SDR family NAD(P)-dependent oxidoreductase n=1 Tax=Pseudonocardia sp. NPDC046786 TaxID=3155471 RepID=UPI0033D77ABB
MPWNPHALPDQSGRVLAVTGATAGIGYFAAEQLAAAGAHVVLLGRSPQKLAVAERRITEQVPEATLSSVVVDLASLESVPAAADRLAAIPALHGIFLNAGPDATVRGVTADGLPVQMGTHAVGNVAFASTVLPLLSRTAATQQGRGRLVFAGTGFVRRIAVSLDDLLQVPRFRLTAYVKAKTALEVYAYELDRRLRADAVPVDAIVSDPGVGVDAKTPVRAGIADPAIRYQRNPFTPWAQGKDGAAWSAVRALTDPDAVGGSCYGPAGAARGVPTRLEPVARTSRPPAGEAQRITVELLRIAGIETGAMQQHR